METQEQVPSTQQIGVLSEKEIIALTAIDEKISELHEKKNNILKKIFEKKGVSEGIMQTADAEKPWLRVRVLDNMEAFASGGTIYKNASFSRFSLEVSRLKNPPKTLAEKK